MADPVSLLAIVHGRVQGVYFRAFVARQARALDVKGYVRNLPEGLSVEVRVEGERERLEELLEQLKVGPPGARVEGIDVDWPEYTGRFSRFEVRY